MRGSERTIPQVENYLFIRAWNTFRAKDAEKLQRILALAEEEHAPHNALYRTQTGKWRTYNDLRNPILQMEIERIACEIEEGEENPQELEYEGRRFEE